MLGQYSLFCFLIFLIQLDIETIQLYLLQYSKMLGEETTGEISPYHVISYCLIHNSCPGLAWSGRVITLLLRLLSPTSVGLKASEKYYFISDKSYLLWKVGLSQWKNLIKCFSKVLSSRCNFCNNMGPSFVIKSIKTRIVKPILIYWLDRFFG